MGEHGAREGVASLAAAEAALAVPAQLPIGSGRAEAPCKTVVGRRLKCTGMRWSGDGATPMLWVRCARLSGWFDDNWDERLRQAA